MNFPYPRCTVLNLQIQLKMCVEMCSSSFKVPVLSTVYSVLCPNMLYFNFALLFCKLCMNFPHPRCTVLNLQIQLKMRVEMCSSSCKVPVLSTVYHTSSVSKNFNWNLRYEKCHDDLFIASEVVSCICYRQVDINSHSA